MTVIFYLRLECYKLLLRNRYFVFKRRHWTSASRLKLNADKTELLFASSSYSSATLSASYPVLQLGADIAVACSHVRSSARRRHLLWSESGSPRLLHLRELLLPTSSTPTSPAVVGLQLVGYTRLRHCEHHGLITATLFLLVHQDSNGQVTVCVDRTLLRVSALGSLIAAWVRYCMTNFTGSTSPTGCFSSWQWQFTGVWTAAYRRTCRTTAFRPPVLTFGSTCVPPTVNCILAVPHYRFNTYGRRSFSVAGPTV